MHDGVECCRGRVADGYAEPVTNRVQYAHTSVVQRVYGIAQLASMPQSGRDCID